MDPIREKLQILDQKAEAAQRQGKYGESLDILEEILNLKRSHYGEESEEYYKTSEKLCELCNLISMICLQKEKFDASLDFLKKAEILCQNSQNYKAITYNNMACYYRRTDKLRTALQYLQKALDIEIKMENPQSLADTHLNLCAVLSQLTKHQEALEHVLLSIVSLQDEYIEIVKNKQNHDTSKNQEPKETTQKPQEDRIAVLAIAYHNMGVELEYLKRFDEAIQTYQKAVKFAQNNLGESHQLVENLKNVLASAQQQIESQKTKENKRKDKKDQVSTLYQSSDKKYKSGQNWNESATKTTKNMQGGYQKQMNIQQRPLQQNNQEFEDQEEQQEGNEQEQD